MAKLKKRSKLSQQRHANSPLPNVNANANKSANKHTNQNNKALALLDKIRKGANTSVNDKLIAVNQILVQCNNEESSRKAFLRNDLVKVILNDLLTEDNKYDELIVSALDLLKHLIIEEDYDLSIHLWRNGIWEILVVNFDKAFKSFSHLNDANVDQISRDLLLSYINNLIGILDNLVLELNSETINTAVIPKLGESTILPHLFEIIKVDNVSKSTMSVVLNTLQLIYDLSSVSVQFLQNVLLSNAEFGQILENLLKTDKFNTHPLGKIFLIGINLQILEVKDNLNENLDLILNEVFLILNGIDFASQKDEEFQIIDISLDLLTTIIEIKGSLLMEDATKKDETFNTKCIESILPFLGKLFESDIKNNKKLVCLNNLMLYLNANELINDNLRNDLESLNNGRISQDFEALLNSNSSKLDLELTIDYLNFKLNLLEMEPSKFSSMETQISKLIETGVKSAQLDEFTDIDLQIQFVTTLIMYLSIVAKNINNIEVTKNIVEYIVKNNVLEPISFYNAQLSTGGLNVSKFHRKYKYLVEETMNVSINSIFEMFDDDYSYNRPIYHDGNMGDILTNALADYKKIYKNIDKNVNLRLKKQSEETLNNLQRFIEYKKTE